jgi:predicted negative regulator of RcsB-dependent stress response
MRQAILWTLVGWLVVAACGVAAWRVFSERRRAQNNAALAAYESRIAAIEATIQARFVAADCTDEKLERWRVAENVARISQDGQGLARARNEIELLLSRRKQNEATQAEADEMAELHRRAGRLRAEGYGP